MPTVLVDALPAGAAWAPVAEARVRALAGVGARVVTGANGRPDLDRDGVDVATTTAGGVRLLAVAAGCRVGLDAERAERRLRAPARFARRALTAAERAAASGVGEAAAGEALLLRLWTAKEAVLKLTGDGIGRNPEVVDAAALLRAAPGTWAVVRLDERDFGGLALRPGGALLVTLAVDAARALVRVTPAARAAIATGSVTP